MLAEPEEIDADLIGEHAFLDEIADNLRRGERLAVRPVGDIAERVEAEFDCMGHTGPFSSACSRRKRAASACSAGRGPPGVGFGLVGGLGGGALLLFLDAARLALGAQRLLLGRMARLLLGGAC